MKTNVSPEIDALLRAVYAKEYISTSTRYVRDGGTGHLLKGVTDQEESDLLNEAQSAGLLSGVNQEALGYTLWSEIHLTLDGLRALRCWPPEGHENAPGVWNDEIWGHVDKKTLERIQKTVPRLVSNPLIIQPDGVPCSEWRNWCSLVRLVNAKLIKCDGDLVVQTPRARQSVVKPRLTSSGKASLAAPATPLEEAYAHLANRNLAEVGASMERAIREALLQFAEAQGVEVSGNAGAINNQLLSEYDRLVGDLNGYQDHPGQFLQRQIQAALDVRNQVGHGKRTRVSDEYFESVLDAVRQLLMDYLD